MWPISFQLCGFLPAVFNGGVIWPWMKRREKVELSLPPKLRNIDVTSSRLQLKWKVALWLHNWRRAKGSTSGHAPADRAAPDQEKHRLPDAVLSHKQGIFFWKIIHSEYWKPAPMSVVPSAKHIWVKSRRDIFASLTTLLELFET